MTQALQHASVLQGVQQCHVALPAISQHRTTVQVLISTNIVNILGLACFGTQNFWIWHVLVANPPSPTTPLTPQV